MGWPALQGYSRLLFGSVVAAGIFLLLSHLQNYIATAKCCPVGHLLCVKAPLQSYPVTRPTVDSDQGDLDALNQNQVAALRKDLVLRLFAQPGIADDGIDFGKRSDAGHAAF
jgi:hypothetical protein